MLFVIWISVKKYFLLTISVWSFYYSQIHLEKGDAYSSWGDNEIIILKYNLIQF